MHHDSKKLLPQAVLVFTLMPRNQSTVVIITAIATKDQNYQIREDFMKSKSRETPWHPESPSENTQKYLFK